MENNKLLKSAEAVVNKIEKFKADLLNENDYGIYMFLQNEQELRQMIDMEDSDLISILKGKLSKYLGKTESFCLFEDPRFPRNIYVTVGDWYGAYTLFKIDVLDLSCTFYETEGYSGKEVMNLVDKITEMGREDFIKDYCRITPFKLSEEETAILEDYKEKIFKLEEAIAEYQTKETEYLEELSVLNAKAIFKDKNRISEIEEELEKLPQKVEDVEGELLRTREGFEDYENELKERKRGYEERQREEINEELDEKKLEVIYAMETIKALEKDGYNTIGEVYEELKNIDKTYMEYLKSKGKK